jgi:pilus assembly protein CpaB
LKGRGLIGGLALILALLATVLVFLYVKNVKDNAENGGKDVSVVVSKEDIPAGTQLDTLLSGGSFETKAIPQDAVVRGAVTSLAQLQGQTTSAAILAGEQISSARLQGNAQPAGGSLGIPKGHLALTLALDSPRIGGGNLQRGDHVTVFATFDSSGKAGQTGASGSASAVTVTLVPDVEMLKVINAVTQGVTGTSGNSDNTVTMALKPKDAQKVVFAEEKGTVWLGLLPPGEKGQHSKPTTIFKVVTG